MTDGQQQELKALRARVAELEQAVDRPAGMPSGIGYRYLLQHANDIIAFVDTTGTLLMINERVRDVLGYTSEEMTGSRFEAFKALRATDLPKYIKMFRKAVSRSGDRKERFLLEVPLVHKNGTSVIVEISTRQIREDGTLKGFLLIIRDVTERRMMHEKLSSTEERFKIMFENAPDAMYLNDMGGVFIDGNRAAEQLVGYNRSELIGKSFLKLNLLPATQLPRAAFSMYSKNALGFASGPDEYTLRHKDGSKTDVEISTYPVKLDGRRMALGIARDISARKRTSAALTESEERYRNMVELAADGIVTMDRKGSVVSCNAAAITLMGYSRNEIIGRHFSTLPTLIPEDVPGHIRTAASLLKGKGRKLVEFNWKRKDGARRIGEARINRIRQFGKVTGMQVTLRDVTDRQSAQQLLLALNKASVHIEQAENLDDVFDAVSDELQPLGVSCTLFDMDSNADTLTMRRISFRGGVMEGVEKMVGGHAVGSSAPVTASPLFKRIILKRETFYNKDIAPFIREFLSIKSDVVSRKICSMLKVSHYIAAPLIVNDVVAGALLIHGDAVSEHDVAGYTVFANQVAAVWHKNKLMQELRDRLRELKVTQGQLLQSQKMEAIGVLAGGVAHDFNNLLTIIIGYSDMALSAGGDSTFMQPAFEIKKAAEQAAELTGQLLAFSRKQPMNLKPVDLNMTVMGMLKMLERLQGEDVMLDTEMYVDVLPVKADAGQVGQVLMNIVINANDALAGGGTITIRTRQQVVDAAYTEAHPDAVEGHYALLEVADTGTGIPDEELRHIFEPFFTTKGPGKGTGLGLSVAYGIIRQHGGWIDVESIEGRGTVFSIFLPVLSGLAESGGPEVVADSSGPMPEGGRVLYVEDAVSVSGFTVLALRERGYAVTTCMTAEEGLEAYRNGKGAFDLVISDVVLPGMTGLEMVSQLLQDNADLKVLLTSGYTDDKSQWPEIREKGIPFLNKPYGINQLYRALDSLTLKGS